MSKLPLTLAGHPAGDYYFLYITDVLNFSGLKQRLDRIVSRRATRRALEGLDDHQLRDIGLTRGSITEAVRRLEPRYRSDS